MVAQFILFGLAVQAVCGDSVMPSARSARAADERAIVTAAIDSLYGSAQGSRLVINAITDVLRGPGAIHVRTYIARYTDLPANAVDDYEERNAVPCEIATLLDTDRLSKSVDFVTGDSLAIITGRGNPTEYWRGFYERFPDSGGLITVSRPGVDSTGTRAVLHVGRGCGPRCGAWGYALMRKLEDGRWTVERHMIHRLS